MITPSEWFEAGSGMSVSANFEIDYYDSGKFKSIKLILNEDEFCCIIVNSYFAAGS
jgi:hypothetical protein